MQINRLFEIIYILLDKKTVTATELAERFEVSVRTIYRDIETLSGAGIPVFANRGKGGGISLLANFVLDKAVLTEEEKLQILSSMRACSALTPSNDDTAMSKLDSMLGDSQSDWIEVDFSSWNNFENDGAYFEMIKKAILAKRLVLFRYSNAKGEKIKRIVAPLKMVFKSAAWYLYGFCQFRQDFRFFKLRRISELEIVDETFKMSAPKKVIVDDIYDENDFIKTIMKISPRMAFRVYDELGSFEIDADGDYICEFSMPDIDSICSYAGSFGEFGEILEPQSARLELKRRMEKMLEKYL